MTIECEKHLFSIIDHILSLSDAAKQAFLNALQPVSFSKNEYLVRAGNTNGRLYFIHRGIVRFVYATESGKELNKSFATEGSFVGCLRSMLTEQPCRFSIQALEETESLFLSNEKRLELNRNYPEWQQFRCILVEQLALKKETREAEFLLDSAETRYRNFLNEYPDLVGRIPQYHIASYLGITDVALSRIRKKLSHA